MTTTVEGPENSGESALPQRFEEAEAAGSQHVTHFQPSSLADLALDFQNLGEDVCCFVPLTHLTFVASVGTLQCFSELPKFVRTIGGLLRGVPALQTATEEFKQNVWMPLDLFIELRANPETAASPKEEAATEEDIEEKNLDGETWLVDGIDDHRKTRHGKLEFLVRWAGPYEPTWEPRANLPEEIISRYFARLRKKVDERRRRKS